MTEQVISIKQGEKRKDSEVVYREKTGKIARKFTKAWFLEYWRGERSLVYAWFGIGFCSRSLLYLVSLIIFSFGIREPLVDIIYLLFMLLIDAPITIFACVSIWRCARNSTIIWFVLARGSIIIAPLIIAKNNNNILINYTYLFWIYTTILTIIFFWNILAPKQFVETTNKITGRLIFFIILTTFLLAII